jgi:hypothetical protein
MDIPLCCLFGQKYSLNFPYLVFLENNMKLVINLIFKTCITIEIIHEMKIVLFTYIAFSQ